MTARFPSGGSAGAETDPVAQPALAAHIAAEPAHGGDLAGTARPPTAHGHPQSDVTGLAAALVAKQDAATAVTDTELTAAVGPAWRAFPWAAGRYYTGFGSTGAAIPPEGQVQYAPLWVPAGAVADETGVEVTTVGTGGVVRLGLYAADANGLPGSLLADFGTVPGNPAGAQFQPLAISFTFPGAALYWTAAVVQGAAGTRPTLRHTNYALFPAAHLTRAAMSAQASGYLQAGISGALPATATPGTMATATGVIRVYFRGA